MTVLKSLLWGYAGAVLAGLGVAIVGLLVGATEPMIVSAAAPTGVVCGLFGFSLVWYQALRNRRPALQRARRRPGR